MITYIYQIMFSRIPFEKVNWTTSSFLIGPLFLSLTAVPVYLWFFGLDWFQVVLFLVMFCVCGFSITLGYHRLGGAEAELKAALVDLDHAYVKAPFFEVA